MRYPLLLSLLLPLTMFAQWTSISPGTFIEFEAVLVSGGNDILVAGEDGTGFRSLDAGTNWTPVTGLGNESIRDFLRLDATTILAASDGVVMRSTDNGGTWSTIPTTAPDDLHALARSGNTVVAVGRDGGIVRSTDGGLSFNGQASGTGERLFAVWASSSTEHFAGGREGVFLHTTNGGSTWTPLALPASDDWTGLHFFSVQPAVGLLCGEDGTMLRTTDSGMNWQAVPTGAALELTGLASDNDTVVYASTATGTAIKSTDLGLTWTTMTSPALSELTAIHVDAGVAVAAGANGTVIKLGGGGGNTGIIQVAEASFTVIADPNARAVYVQGPALQNRVVIVFDAHGRQVAQQRTSGQRTVIDAAAWPAGVYSVMIPGQPEAHRIAVLW